MLGALRLGCARRWLGPIFRWAVSLDRWAMLDVFLLAVAVGYFYLTTIEHLPVIDRERRPLPARGRPADDVVASHAGRAHRLARDRR